MSMPSTGLSIGFEVDGDILKVDGYEGRRHPNKRGVWGRLTPPAGYRGRSPRKQNELNPLTPVPAVTGHAKTHPQFPVLAVTGREKACADNCLSYPP